MNLLSVLMVCVAALHFATAAFVAMHHVRRPSDTNFLPIAGICFSQALSAIGIAALTEAARFQQAVIGQQLQMLGAVLALASFSALATRSSPGTAGYAARIIQAWAVVTVIAIACGWCFYAEPRVPRTIGFDWAPDYQEARFTPLGITLTWIIFPVALYMMRRANQRPLVPIGAVEWWLLFGLGSLAFWNDTLVRFGPVRSIYLNEIVTLIMALNANRRLRQRFKATTDELLVRTAELELSALELDQMQTQIVRRQQLAAVGEFSAVIAHEVRNPLAIIKNAISALRRSADVSHQPELLTILDEEIARLQRLVSDLSTYTRPLVPRAAPTSLEPLVRRVITRTRTADSTLAQLSIHVHVDASALVFGDADLIEMALTNVLANAAQATPKDGAISVECQAYQDASEGVELRVIDTGSGMTPDVAAKAREPFFTTRSTGTGLGLAIVDRVMRAHHGQFEIESNDAGTRITLRFPNAKATSTRS